MQRQTINLPRAEVLSQPRSRRDFLKALAAVGTGVAVGSAAFSQKAFGQVPQELNNDIDIANFALALEFLEAEFYQKAVNSGVLSGEALSYVAATGDHENQHVDAIIGLINQFGGTPIEKPQFTFPSGTFASQSSILELAATFEPVGVGAYLGALPLIESPDVVAAAASIEVIEGEHVVAINDLLGVVPPAQTPFPESLSQAEVLEAVAPFLGMGAMPDTGGVPQG